MYVVIIGTFLYTCCHHKATNILTLRFWHQTKEPELILEMSCSRPRAAVFLRAFTR
jgi:hypothetical protein